MLKTLHTVRNSRDRDPPGHVRHHGLTQHFCRRHDGVDHWQNRLCIWLGTILGGLEYIVAQIENHFPPSLADSMDQRAQITERLADDIDVRAKNTRISHPLEQIWHRKRFNPMPAISQCLSWKNAPQSHVHTLRRRYSTCEHNSIRIDPREFEGAHGRKVHQ